MHFIRRDGTSTSKLSAVVKSLTDCCRQISNAFQSHRLDYSLDTLCEVLDLSNNN